MLDIQIKTEGLSDLLRTTLELPGLFARARASALRSTGWAVQQDIKETGKMIQPRLNPHTGVLSVTKQQGGRAGRNVRWAKRRVDGKWKTGTSRLHGRFMKDGKSGWVAKKLSTREQPFSRWINMIRYKVDASDLIAEIGLLRPKPNYYQWMAKNVSGWDVPVTPKMRRFLFATGFPIKKNTARLRIPSRRWMDVVKTRWEAKAGSHFEKKFWEAYDRYTTGKKFNFRTE